MRIWPKPFIPMKKSRWMRIKDFFIGGSIGPIIDPRGPLYHLDSIPKEYKKDTSKARYALMLCRELARGAWDDMDREDYKPVDTVNKLINLTNTIEDGIKCL